MTVRGLLRRHPVPSLASAAFGVASAATVAYFVGIVPGVPKTLPTFVDLLLATVGLLAVALLAWAVSLTGE